MVLVSHDRAFLNNVTTRTIEISCGHIYDYKVKYDEFVKLRKERREQQLRAYEPAPVMTMTLFMGSFLLLCGFKQSV